MYNLPRQTQRVIDSAHSKWASLGRNTGNRGGHGVVAQNPPLDGRPTTYLVGRTRNLPGAWVPALLLLAVAALYLLFHDAQHAYYLFFLPVAFAGVGLGARAGVLAAVISMVVVISRYLVEGRAYLTGELSAPTIELESFVIWATFLALTGYIVGLVSERGGSRGVGRDLGTEIMKAVEREHMRLGYDLHDTVAQNAAGSLMEAEILSSMLHEADSDVRGQSERVTKSMNACMDQIRGAITHLRPPALSQSEFAETLRGIVDDFALRTGIKIEFSVEGDPETHTDSMRICIFRVIQEALNNVEQHAQASRVFVGIRATKRTVYLLVGDDGVGFDPSAYANNGSNGHFGLSGMRERVTLLGGELAIKAAPNQGTNVRARIPAL